jgi:predicted glutamine amidotransferase
MCRFLIVSSEKEIDPQPFAEGFADVCQKSIAPNGDKQEDGWGVSWIENHKWKTIHSLSPIWEDRDIFLHIARTTKLVIHARSATFPKEKGILSYNQPYAIGKYCFVFNGALFGVRLGKPVSGEIGSQKIWSLLQDELASYSLPDSINRVKDFLEKNSKEIIALNMGIVTKESVSVLCKYSKETEYYTLHYHKSDFQIICSEKLPEFSFTPMKNDEVFSI